MQANLDISCYFAGFDRLGQPLFLTAGMKTLRQDGWKKVKAGITSLSEVLRVSHADEFVGSGRQENEKK